MLLPGSNAWPSVYFNCKCTSCTIFTCHKNGGNLYTYIFLQTPTHARMPPSHPERKTANIRLSEGHGRFCFQTLCKDYPLTQPLWPNVMELLSQWPSGQAYDVPNQTTASAHLSNVIDTLQNKWQRHMTIVLHIYMCTFSNSRYIMPEIGSWGCPYAVRLTKEMMAKKFPNVCHWWKNNTRTVILECVAAFNIFTPLPYTNGRARHTLTQLLTHTYTRTNSMIHPCSCTSGNSV